MIKIKLEFTSLLAIDHNKNGSTLEIEEGTTILDLLDQLGIKENHQKYIVPFVNKKGVKRTEKLKNDDVVFLFLTVGGG